MHVYVWEFNLNKMYKLTNYILFTLKSQSPKNDGNFTLNQTN